ncbi:hypothetical protein EVAR_67700_1, partial [Eumeta japonica]
MNILRTKQAYNSFELYGEASHPRAWTKRAPSGVGRTRMTRGLRTCPRAIQTTKSSTEGQYRDLSYVQTDGTN